MGRASHAIAFTLEVVTMASTTTTAVADSQAENTSGWALPRSILLSIT